MKKSQILNSFIQNLTENNKKVRGELAMIRNERNAG